MKRLTALITEDGPDPVRVLVVHDVVTLPYYAAHQQFDFHAGSCPSCSGESSFPCPVGGVLGDLAWTALEHMQHLARQN